jgi:hypothetical protein
MDKKLWIAEATGCRMDVYLLNTVINKILMFYSFFSARSYLLPSSTYVGYFPLLCGSRLNPVRTRIRRFIGDR